MRQSDKALMPGETRLLEIKMAVHISQSNYDCSFVVRISVKTDSRFPAMSGLFPNFFNNLYYLDFNLLMS